MFLDQGLWPFLLFIIGFWGPLCHGLLTCWLSCYVVFDMRTWIYYLRHHFVRRTRWYHHVMRIAPNPEVEILKPFPVATVPRWIAKKLDRISLSQFGVSQLLFSFFFIYRVTFATTLTYIRDTRMIWTAHQVSPCCPHNFRPILSPRGTRNEFEPRSSLFLCPTNGFRLFWQNLWVHSLMCL